MIHEALHKLRRSFPAKIILLVVSSVIMTSMVVGIATTRGTNTFLRVKTSEKFPSLLAGAKSKVRSWYMWQFRDIERLSQASTVLTYVAHGRGHSDPRGLRELRRYLEYVRGDFAIYESLSIAWANGDLIATSDSSGSNEDVTMLDPRVRDWVESSPDAPHFTAAQFDTEHHRVVQWILVPIRRNDQVVAWAIARINLRQLELVLEEIHLDPAGDLFLLDSQGRFVTHPRRGSSDLRTTFAMQVPTRQVGPVTVETRRSYNGDDVFHSKVYLEELGWWLVYEEDYNAAMAPVIRAQRRSWLAVLIVMAMAGLAAFRVAKSILRPISDLTLGARRINEGLVAVKIRRGVDDEIGYLIDTFNEMARQISLSQAELQYRNKQLNTQNETLETVNEKLEQLSVTDGLTGLFNHRHFWNLLNNELARVTQYSGSLALILIDLDDFKRINDQFGHSVGDLVLQSVARVLIEAVRDTDIVSRYGGEEFVVLLPDTDLDGRGVEQIAEHVRRAVEGIRFKVPDTDISVRITTSIGVSVYSGNRRDFFNDADRALYRSKAEGKNRVHYAFDAAE